MARSLEGNWRREHLFALGQALAQFDFLGAQIKECDAAIAESLERLPAVGTGDVEMSKVMKSPHRSAQQRPTRRQLIRATRLPEARARDAPNLHHPS